MPDQIGVLKDFPANARVEHGLLLQCGAAILEERECADDSYEKDGITHQKATSYFGGIAL